MVVFGAGASYDSCPTHAAPVSEQHGDNYRDCRLPLGNNLFEERELFWPILEQYPRALDVVSRLRHLKPGTNVETVMEELRAEAVTDPRRHRQLAAIRYYLQSAIWDCTSQWDRRAAHGESNYKTLLDRIEHQRKPDETVCLVSFNYDTLLEAALPTVGLEIRSIGDYVSGNYKVIKVHGSINWGREVESPVDNVAAVNDQRLVYELIDKAESLKVTDRYHVAHQRPIVRIDPERPMIPAIAIPVQTKGAFECPKEHLASLDECLPKIERILVIGWRANEGHFLRLLRERGRQAIRAFIVAGQRDYAALVIENLKGCLDRPDKLVPSQAGFTYFTLYEAVNFLDSF